MQRVSVVPHGAAQLVLVDFSTCEPGTYAPVIQQAQRLICKQPLRSVRAVAVFQDVRFDMGTVKEMKDYVSTITPHLARCALVGIDGMKKIVFGGIKPLFSVEVELFADLAAAKDWAAGR
jgi:hypothetical protein